MKNSLRSAPLPEWLAIPASAQGHGRAELARAPGIRGPTRQKAFRASAPAAGPHSFDMDVDKRTGFMTSIWDDFTGNINNTRVTTAARSRVSYHVCFGPILMRCLPIRMHFRISNNNKAQNFRYITEFNFAFGRGMQMALTPLQPLRTAACPDAKGTPADSQCPKRNLNSAPFTDNIAYGEFVSTSSTTEAGTIGREPGICKSGSTETAADNVTIAPDASPAGPQDIPPGGFTVGKEATVRAYFSPGGCGVEIRQTVLTFHQGSDAGSICDSFFDSFEVGQEPRIVTGKRRTIALAAKVTDGTAKAFDQTNPMAQRLPGAATSGPGMRAERHVCNRPRSVRARTSRIADIGGYAGHPSRFLGAILRYYRRTAWLPERSERKETDAPGRNLVRAYPRNNTELVKGSSLVERVDSGMLAAGRPVAGLRLLLIAPHSPLVARFPRQSPMCRHR